MTETHNLKNGEEKKCSKCETTENLQLCGKCRSHSYCSKRCQKKDWKKGHMDICEKSVCEKEDYLIIPDSIANLISFLKEKSQNISSVLYDEGVLRITSTTCPLENESEELVSSNILMDHLWWIALPYIKEVKPCPFAIFSIN